MLFLFALNQTCTTHAISSLNSSMLSLISEETTTSLITLLQLYLSIKPFILWLNAFCIYHSIFYPYFLDHFHMFFFFLNRAACFCKVNILRTSFVFEHFLHFCRLSYIPFITSHKNYLFAFSGINKWILYYVFFRAWLPFITLVFNAFLLAEYTFILLFQFPPGVHLATL